LPEVRGRLFTEGHREVPERSTHPVAARQHLDMLGHLWRSRARDGSPQAHPLWRCVHLEQRALSKDPDTNKATRVTNPESAWIVKGMPELRIVPPDLWDRVQRRQQQQSKATTAIQRAQHHKARTGAGPKYLFSSLLKCFCCGANYVMSAPNVYGCATNLG